MGLNARNSGNEDFPLCPAGTFVGRCYMVIDLGLQESSYQGVDSLQHKVRIGWELPTELMDNGKPWKIGKEYTLSLNEKANLYKDLISWRGAAFSAAELDPEGDGFDIFRVKGAPCQLTVIHKESGTTKKSYANVIGVSKLMKGAACADLTAAYQTFSFDDDGTPEDHIDEWIRKKIGEAKYSSWDDYNRANKADPDASGDSGGARDNAPSDFDDYIPF